MWNHHNHHKQHKHGLTSQAEDTFLYALSSNNAWAGYKSHQNPQFFPKLASGQTPQIRKLLILPLHLISPKPI